MASSDYERDFDALIQHLLPKVQESLRAADKEVDKIICRAFERAKRTDAAIRAANDGRTSLAVGSKRQDLAVLEPGYQEAIRTIFDPLAEAFWNEEIESFMMSLRRIRELLWKRPQPSVDYDWKGSVWRVEEEWQIRKGQHCDERGDETVRQVQLQEFVKKYASSVESVGKLWFW